MDYKDYAIVGPRKEADQNWNLCDSIRKLKTWYEICKVLTQ